MYEARSMTKCLLTRGVCLQEVSVSGGSTVFFLGSPICFENTLNTHLLKPCLSLQPSSFSVFPLLHKLLSLTVFLAAFASSLVAFHAFLFPLLVLFAL